MLSKFEIILLMFLVPLLLFQGFWVFNDAKKRGIKFYWIWGILCTMNTPTNLLIYLLFSRVIREKRKNNNT
ncbi:hypothetical protein SAMN05444401_3675 [Clostridium amylolyticum]|uniref:SigmaY antisigma factor component n=1 Tax=Clostridium amylolyticum TaxID=1121298 RepID=A0A1M6LK84_9CLOT|nr:hypothetical protein [Clostridium amylolyticum]SHJ71590.1 hypothetical protein SAMN05444401_3675 [Clostridium amylolyticum]